MSIKPPKHRIHDIQGGSKNINVHYRKNVQAPDPDDAKTVIQRLDFGNYWTRSTRTFPDVLSYSVFTDENVDLLRNMFVEEVERRTGLKLDAWAQDSRGIRAAIRHAYDRYLRSPDYFLGDWEIDEHIALVNLNALENLVENGISYLRDYDRYVSWRGNVEIRSAQPIPELSDRAYKRGVDMSVYYDNGPDRELDAPYDYKMGPEYKKTLY